MKKELFSILLIISGLLSVSCLKLENADETKPSITGINPSSGYAGTSVTISGSNFSTDLSGNIVKFNGVTAAVTSASATQLVVTVPSGASSGSVTVTVGSSTATSSGTFTITSAPANSPAIGSFTPLEGNIGTVVTITGSNFSTTASSNIVKFNGITATITESTNTQLTVIVPDGATTGAISVTVGTLTATSSAIFTVNSSTTVAINNISPTSGVAGSSVIITGTNFSATPENNIVKFNGTTATVTAATSSQLTVTVPAGATTGNISVTTNTQTATSSAIFTVLSASNDVVITYSGTTATVTNPYQNNGVSVAVTNGNVVVTSTLPATEVNYVLSGTATKGSFKIYSDYKFVLILDGVNLTNDSGPAVNIQSSKQVSFVVKNSTNNYLADGTTYVSSSEDQKGTLFSEGQIIFTGGGNLSVTGNYKHAICSDDYISVNEGNITITKAASDGIHANDYFVMEGGTLSITATGNGIECEEGYVEIKSGNLTINSTDDGISSSYEGTLSTVTPYIKISGGVINVTTSGEKGNALKSVSYTTINSGNTITLKVTGRGSKGIKTGGDLNLTNCNLNITTSGASFYDTEDADITSPAGINCDGSLLLTQGNITISSSGSGGKGITVDKVMTINGGTLNITTTGTIFKYGSTESEAKAIKSDGAFTMNGGGVTVSSADDGIKSETSVTINAGTVNITKSVEGIEAPNIILAGGNITVVSSDDSLNATKGNGGEANDGSLLTFSGANVYLSATSGDPIDSNGSVVMTGGTVVVNGPQSQPEVAIDVNGTFNISGGFLIASGPNSGNMIEGTSTSSSQYAVLIKINGNVSAGTLFNIQSTSGTSLVTFAPSRSSYYFVFSSSALQTGVTYKVYTGGSCSGATVTNGFYSGGTYTPGTQKGTFTLSSKLTTVSL